MLYQTHSPALRQKLATAHLAQTMTLLEMSASELREHIESSLAKNPALELFEERRCPTCRRRLYSSGPCPVCSRPKSASGDEAIIFLSPREDFHTYSGPADDADLPDETQAAPEEDLPHYVLRQIAAELKPAQRPVAAYILTNLNDDGLLEVPIIEVARFNHVLPSQVEAVLKIINRADPVGVGAPSTLDAMLVQLEVLRETTYVPAKAEDMIRTGMSLLSRRRYPELARLLGVSVPEVRGIASFITQNLNPFPARAHWGEMSSFSHSAPSGDNTYRSPDIIIARMSDKEDAALIIEIAMPISGTLRVNPLFKEALRQAPPDKADQWKSDLDQATLLVKCLQQRNHTIVRLMQRLATLQRGFILHGETSLQPITRAQLSKELDVHESTISRAVSEKAVQLPNGHIVPLSMFFDRSLHIRSALRQIVSGESHPLSDTELGARLAQIGYPVARRTIAKYRAIEGILPAHLRKPNIIENPAIEAR